MVLRSEILSQEKDVVLKERLKELLELSQRDDILDLIQNLNRRYSTWEKFAIEVMEKNKKMMKDAQTEYLSMFLFLFTYHPKNKQKLRVELKPFFHNGLLSSTNGQKLTVSKLKSSSNEIILGVLPMSFPLSSENYPILTIRQLDYLKEFVKNRLKDIFDELSEDYLDPKNSNNSNGNLKKYIPYN